MPKVTLYNAVSADGFIAGPNDETPWSDEEWAAFQNFVKSCDVVLLGRRTYSIMRDGGEFIEGPRYIVVTHNADVDTAAYEKLTINSAHDLPSVEKIGLIGGAELNGSLADLGLIDEIILDVESVVLGGGKHLLGERGIHMELVLLSSSQIGPTTVQNHYRVKRDR